MEKAIEYFIDGNYLMAMNAFVGTKNKKDKNYTKSLFYLGFCYCHFRQYKEAELVYTEFFRLTKPHEYEVLFHDEKSHDKMTLGCVYRVLGDVCKSLDRKSDCRKYYESSLRSLIITGDNIAIEEIKSRLLDI
ncbi:MAG: hypothetical protein JEZ08_00675 [Clostridiales bacterium]|nr:hypothetical protein [Clostridiales bacterium]